MKKILTFVIIGLASCMASWAQSPKPVDQIVKAYNEKCPMDVAEGTTLQNVELGKDGFVFYHIVADDLFANLATLGSILHDSLVAELASSPDVDTQALISYCKTNKTNIIQRFVNSKGKQFDVTILPTEL